MKRPPVSVRNSFLLTTTAVIGLLLIGAPNAMSLLNGKSSLTGPWKERFQDVTKLNTYAKTQPVELANVEIKNKNIDGVVLNSGKFENTDWTEVSAKGANLTNVTFRKGTLEAVDFTDSTFTNVTFEDVTLREVRFFGPTLNNVRFVRCEFDAVNIDRTKNSRIEVIDSKIENSSLSRGQLIAVFRNSKLSDQTALTSLMPPSSLTFEKSELIQVNLDRSKLKSLVIEDSKYDAVLDAGSVDSVVIKNSSVDTSFSASTIGKLSLTNTVVTQFSFNKANAGSMFFEHCSQLKDFVMYGTAIDTLDIAHCKVSDFYPAVATIGTLRLRDSTLTKSGFERLKAKTMILENVSLDGEINFTGAQIGELKTHNIAKQPGLNLITTGSNVRF